MLEDPDPREDEVEIETPDDDGGDPPELEAVEDEEPVEDVEEPVEAEDEPVEDEEPSPAPRKVAKTKEENFAAVRARERAATERAATLERELQQERANRAQPVQQQGETPQARQARLAAMAPDERAVALAAEGEERIHRLSAMAEFRMAEREDKADFAELTRGDPRAKKYAAEVESVLLAERQQGKNWPRKTILAFILGNRVMANAPKAKKQQDVARTEAARQTGNPAKSKGDVGGGKKQLSEAQAREKRLLNVRL
jgi:hypothetical protein